MAGNRMMERLGNEMRVVAMTAEGADSTDR
jgi:hypothetical protein